jgi:hypothetical protein
MIIQDLTPKGVFGLCLSLRPLRALGEDEFVDKLADHLRKHKDIPEIPRSQRYADRPALEKLFVGDVSTNVRKRRVAVKKAVERYGYSLRQIAAQLGIHDSSVSRILKGER